MIPFSVPIALLAMSREEDRDFLSALYLRYRDRMMVYACSRTASLHDAEDAIQDTMAAMTENVELLRTFEDPHLEGYLFTTLKHFILMKHRRQPRTGELSDQTADPGEDTEEAVLRILSVEELMAAMRRLDEESVLILQMKYFQQLSGREMAEALHISEAALRARLSRIRRRLRMLMEEGRP